MLTRTIRVLCVDDHQLLVDGLHSRIGQENSLEFVGHLTTAENLVSEVKSTGAEIVLLDLEMPGPDPFEAIKELGRLASDTKVIVLSGYIRDHYVDTAIKAGAWGYLSKNDDVDEIVSAIRKVQKGEFVFGPSVMERCDVASPTGRRPKMKEAPSSKLESLTRRELEILRMIGRGMGRKEIAEELHRSPRTVDNHRASIMRKLDISDRVEIVRYAIREKLVEV